MRAISTSSPSKTRSIRGADPESGDGQRQGWQGLQGGIAFSVASGSGCHSGGEIRDTETARIAAQAALTGHLVLTTLHTNDAIQATTRLLEMGVERFIVAPSIIGVLGQRLVKRLCEYCKTEHRPNREELRQYFYWREGAELPVFYTGAGCGHCGESGYAGRVGIS